MLFHDILYYGHTHSYIVLVISYYMLGQKNKCDRGINRGDK